MSPPGAATVAATAAAATAATAAIFAWASFVNDDLATVDFSLVHLFDRSCDLVVFDFYEAKAATFNNSNFRRSVFRKGVAKRSLTYRKRGCR